MVSKVNQRSHIFIFLHTTIVLYIIFTLVLLIPLLLIVFFGFGKTQNLIDFLKIGGSRYPLVVILTALFYIFSFSSPGRKLLKKIQIDSLFPKMYGISYFIISIIGVFVAIILSSATATLLAKLFIY